VARILIVGGGCRGRLLAQRAIEAGHAVRITTRTPAGCKEVERAGAECWVGTPMRLATLRGSLDRVAVACWLLGTATGTDEELAELFGPRLELFMTQAIDTTVRCVVYEASGTVKADMLGDGERRARSIAERSSIPFIALRADPMLSGDWLGAASAAIDGVLSSP
jgi:hypothetical protein